MKRGDCRLSVPHLAAVAGVAETTVRTAIRQVRQLGLVTVETRRLAGWRNDTNIVRIVSAECRLGCGSHAGSVRRGEGAILVRAILSI